jgi:hypothetical protein
MAFYRFIGEALFCPWPGVTCGAGSRNAFEEKRKAGQAPSNLGDLCGQPGDAPCFAGQPMVTCSDNAARHAGRVDPAEVQQIPLWMIRQLMKRRLFDHARWFDTWHVLLVDGRVQEKCRKGFEPGGQARYR